MNIRIPEPCSVPLSDMKPVKGGFYCDSCAKKVTDFRDWSETDIQHYFKEQAGTKPCGIFKNTQIQETKAVIIIPNVDSFQLTFRQQFLYALLICFSTLFFSCGDPQTTGELVVENPYLETLPIKNDSSITRLEKDSAITLEREETFIPEIVGAYQIPLMEEITAGAPVVDIIEPPVEIITEDKMTKGEIVSCAENKNSSAVGLMSFGKMPEFPGGQMAMYKFLEKNLRYPETEKKNNLKGRVVARFTINEDGSISDITIKESVEGAPGFDEEVIRVIQLMPKWKPEMRGKYPVKTTFNLPVDFSLDKKRKNKDK